MSDSVREAFEKLMNIVDRPRDVTWNNVWQAATAAADAEWRGVVGEYYVVEESECGKGWFVVRNDRSERIMATCQSKRDAQHIVTALAKAAELLGRK